MSEEVKDIIEPEEEVKDDEEKVDNGSTDTISKSKAKREARKAEVKASKKKKAFGRIIETIVGLAIAAVFIGAIVMGIWQSATTVSPNNAFGAGLTEEGFIEGADLSSVKDLKFESMVISKADIEYSEDKIRADVDSALTSAKYSDDDASLTVKDGDTINLDYTGYVDDVAFDGGSAQGSSLTIGSGSFIDDFEQQLIGSHPGDEVTVNVTFPDPYDNNPDLAGKDARFECKVNSITVIPELTDEFVKEHYAGVASTAEELKEYFKKNGEEANLENYLVEYLNNNASAGKYPKEYVKNLASVLYYSDEQNYDYTNQYYQYILGTPRYGSFSEYTGMSDSDYQKSLKERAKTTTAVSMTLEKIYKEQGLKYTDEQYSEVVAAYGDEATYGKGFITQNAIKLAAMEYIKSVVTVQ
ncbi:MAG: FKBP-type peptidyl-prolyl cis-trans isomerase [Lachnospiraceae bacterium]|nr:FKBP-type peptidyl-prolyl cis-trans isomerase [Lachnospiraceae bacterium]